ncbi:chemotaxis protein CheW [Telmatospirillum sp. J64-1]|uniref:chemotaxis protein CheW n=1 Tax=Telmatospirillum sp. J64-1 TaxID=2502183 RepID=UPI00115D3FEA|nr:chemotaxis protein CheW [Telmatospirillum sp. J64-1]
MLNEIDLSRLFRERAEHLARPRGIKPVLGEAALAFRLREDSYALALSALVEVAPLTSVTPIPAAPEMLLGVANQRGDIRPVLDLHRMLGLPPPPADTPAHLLFLRRPQGPVAVRVEALLGSMRLGELSPPPQGGRFTQGVTTDGIILLAPDQILDLDFLTTRHTPE